MPKKITKLTPEQEAMMPLWANRWIAKGLQTGDTDWDTFDRWMPVCYAKAGIPYPTAVVRVSSPIVGALAAPIADRMLKGVAMGDAVQSAVQSAVWSAVGDAVQSAVGDAVWSAVGSAVGSAVQSAVWSAVGDAVGSAVGSAVQSAVGSAVGDAVGQRFKWQNWLGGQFGVGYWWGPAFVSFFREVCGLELDSDIAERAEAYQKICESVNYIWPNRNFVMVCARPTKIVRDNQGRLHNNAGKAIEYPDGWGIYMLSGVRFEEPLYTRVISGSMTLKEILDIENTEQRLQAMRYNPNALLKENPKLIHLSERGNELWLIENSQVNDLYDEPKVWLLGFVDPSKKAPHNKMYEEVEPDLAAKYPDADVIQARHLGLTPRQYKKLTIET